MSERKTKLQTEIDLLRNSVAKKYDLQLKIFGGTRMATCTVEINGEVLPFTCSTELRAVQSAVEAVRQHEPREEF